MSNRRWFFFAGFLIIVAWGLLFENFRLLHVIRDQQTYIDAGCNGRYQGEE